MKLKIALGILVTTALLHNASAQEAATMCEGSLKSFEDQVKEGSYDAAAVSLEGLRKSCSKYSEKIYTQGESVLKYNIEAAQDDAQRLAFIDALVALYKEYDKNFPQNTYGGDVKQAMLLNQYKIISQEDFFKRLDAAWKKNSRNFTDHNSLEAYFMMYLSQYQAGNKGITQEQFIEKYGEVSGQAVMTMNDLVEKRDALQLKQQDAPLSEDEQYLLTLYGPAIEGFDATVDNINILASKHFTCDKLELYYEKNWETRQTDVVWLEALVDVMFRNRCHNSAMLQKAAYSLHQLKPSAQSAQYLGSLAQRKNKRTDAVAYFEQSAKLEKTAEKKAERYYTIATLLRGSNNKQAKEYALRSAQMNPKSAKPYLFLAEMYSSPGKDCGLSPFETKALNWLAIETLKKAELAEPKYKATVAAMSERFAKKAPTKDEVKAAGKKKGKAITFGCWINETITIPNL